MNKQHERIIAYLKAHKTISPMEAWNELGITKLATRISELRAKGYEFYKSDMRTINRFGEAVSYKQYELRYAPRKKEEA